MYISIKVSLVSGPYAYEDWSCEIELSEKTSLRELNEIILNAVGFDNDHFSQFFISRREFGSSRESFDDRTYSLDTELYGLFPLPKGKKLFYWFDYGDDWIFQVSKSRSKPKPFADGAEYPRTIKEAGVKPEQYPESEW